MAIRFLFIRKSKPYQYLKDKFLYGRAYIQYKLNPYPEEVGENPIFIFNHIPKCGGTSLVLILGKWFYLRKDYSPLDIKYPNRNDFLDAYENFKNSQPEIFYLKPWEIIVGHYYISEIRLSERFPGIYNNLNVNKITFVRDPLSHHLSLFKFGKERGHNFVKGMELTDYLHEDSNYMAKSLECTQENYKSIIDSYFFVGIVERYDDSIKVLSKLLGKDQRIDIPNKNTTNSKSLYQNLSKEDIDLFKINNSLDYNIYNYCNSIFNNNYCNILD
ncbi:sulfotransferase family 2 domain-containing protein [Algoriphagus machipongonensis]|uniref:Sulfotransferase family protein n=1 Tax=Algoriphagus machipongonensis TaxID=388413 RepID=A3HRH2_9BACT|nr:sulfotransferase family 2 domain-containing protein [Algoriphagus machipongonensis]EAZ82440.1 hypothetical protein ALPR1_09505 [Algoriphagus machipongonensis]